MFSHPKPDKEKTIDLLLNANLSRIDAITTMRAYNSFFGELYDWHEFAYLLDDLYREGIITRSTTPGYDTFTVYEVKR